MPQALTERAAQRYGFFYRKEWSNTCQTALSVFGPVGPNPPPPEGEAGVRRGFL